MIKWKKKNLVNGVMIREGSCGSLDLRPTFAHTTSVSNPSNPIVFSQHCATTVDGFLVACSKDALTL